MQCAVNIVQHDWNWFCWCRCCCRCCCRMECRAQLSHAEYEIPDSSISIHLLRQNVRACCSSTKLQKRLTISFRAKYNEKLLPEILSNRARVDSVLVCRLICTVQWPMFAHSAHWRTQIANRLNSEVITCGPSHVIPRSITFSKLWWQTDAKMLNKLINHKRIRNKKKTAAE